MDKLNRKSGLSNKPTLKHKHITVTKKLVIALAIVLVATGIFIKLEPYTYGAKIRRELESKSHLLQQTRDTLEQTQVESKQQYEDQQKQLKEVQQKLQETEKALQAKRSTPVVLAAAAPKYVPSGNKEQWMSEAGIPADVWWAVDYIVSRESGWRPDAINRNGGACGLVQALPCSKLGPNWSDPVVALKWQLNYVTRRYGGYPQAVAFWKANHWY